MVFVEVRSSSLFYHYDDGTLRITTANPLLDKGRKFRILKKVEVTKDPVPYILKGRAAAGFVCASG